MSNHDLNILQKNHDEAVENMGRAAVAIAECALDGLKPAQWMLEEYRKQKVLAENSRRDLEYALSLELDEIMGN